jgi:hypothetical protein
MNVYLKKLTNESKGKPEQKFDAAVGASFRISKYFQQCRGSVTFWCGSGSPDPNL